MLHQLNTPDRGTFVAPTLIKVDGIGDLKAEVFGPVLHIATFKSHELDKVIDDINASGYGLTFGLHTRIDDRVQHVSDRIAAGNVYVNRNQIGAIVGSQHFGGIGLSGTGPKAGGPDYLLRFRAPHLARSDGNWNGAAPMPTLPRAPISHAPGVPLPGPTGESNVLSQCPRPAILCAGPGAEAAASQVAASTALGGQAVPANGALDPDALPHGPQYGGVLWWGDAKTGAQMAQALSRRDGPIVPVITQQPDRAHATVERHICVDTTASGGNAALLGAAS